MGDLGGTSDNEHPSSGALNRRNMLKAAVAAGAGVAAWTAPDIKTLGFTRAGAQGSVLSFRNTGPDINANNGQHDCTLPVADDCCDIGWGNSGGTPETFTFVDPTPGCTFVVGVASLDCGASTNNPDISQARLFVQSSTGCDCEIVEAIISQSNGTEITRVNAGTGAASGVCDPGDLDISVDCDVESIPANARLSVVIECMI